MSAFPITEDFESASKRARQTRPDGVGCTYHTFRVRIGADDETGHGLLTCLVDEGWQLLGGPVVIEATEEIPRHVVLTMLRSEPRPLEIRGRLELRGNTEIRGEAELRQ